MSVAKAFDTTGKGPGSVELTESVTPHQENELMTTATHPLNNSLATGNPLATGTALPTGNAAPADLVIGRRIALGVGLIFAVIFGVIALSGDAAATGPIEAPADTIEIYVVQPGDSLWAIATDLSQPGDDVRPLVDALREAAGGSALEIGQRIIIDHADLTS